jgi:hypothetical protein
MPNKPSDAVATHLQQVGWLCSQWAYLEWLLEKAIWWFLDLKKTPSDGQTVTGGLSIDALARKARDLAHRKLSTKSDLKAMADIATRLKAIIDERNLAIHGVRSVQPDNTVQATVTRGPYKYQPQPLSSIRLRSLNDEVARLIGVIEPLLHRHGVITGSGPIG